MTTTKREFICKLEHAWAEISKLDAELVKRTGKPARSREDVESIINIDTANEEIARLDAKIAELEADAARPTTAEVKPAALETRPKAAAPVTQILRRNFIPTADAPRPQGVYGIARAIAANSKKKS